MELLLGIFIGFIGCIVMLASVGGRAYRKEYRRLMDEQGPVWHPNKPECTDGHKWCQDHAKAGKFHCEVCGYAMEQ